MTTMTDTGSMLTALSTGVSIMEDMIDIGSAASSDLAPTFYAYTGLIIGEILSYNLDT